MAEDKKEVEVKQPKTSKYKVKQEFKRGDLVYKIGSHIELPNGQLKDSLISNKLI